MSIKFYVLVQTVPAATSRVFDELSLSSLFLRTRQVFGRYDIVVEVVTPDLSDIASIVATKIRAIDGVLNTTTLVAMPVAKESVTAPSVLEGAH